MRKKIGHCAQCREFVWKANTDPKEWPGFRATAMLADGSFMDLTLCTKCMTQPDLDLIWRIVIDGWSAEGGTFYARAQARTNFILTISYTKPWNEVHMVPFVALAENKDG